MEFTLHEIQKKLEYQFNNEQFLLIALTHPSVHAMKKHNIHFQRLEFLGDAVLKLSITEILYHTYPNASEGHLALMYNNAVCTNAVSSVAKTINLGSYLILNHGEEKNGGRSNLRNLENTLEAIIGAINLDSGYQQTKAVIQQLWKKILEGDNINLQDPKSQLQEWAQKHHYPIPQYNVIQHVGSDHLPIFTIVVTVGKWQSEGTANNKKTAQREAAKSLLTLLK